MSGHYGLLERTTMGAYNSLYAATMAMPPKREHYPQFTARVSAVSDPTPAFRRVTLAAPEWASVVRTGADEYVGLFMPPAGTALVLPDNALNPRTPLAKINEEVRPDLRWYTLSDHRAEVGEVDIDIVSGGHDGHDGPGARWTSRVRVGDPVGVRVQTGPYGSAPTHGHQLLLADETGLPGLLAILRAHGDEPHRHLSALVEVPGEDHVLPGTRELGVQVVLRGDDAPGSALLPTLAATPLPELDFAWVCAEAATIAGARRELVKERGLARRKVMAIGFWKVGRERL